MPRHPPQQGAGRVRCMCLVEMLRTDEIQAPVQQCMKDVGKAAILTYLHARLPL